MRSHNSTNAAPIYKNPNSGHPSVLHYFLLLKISINVIGNKVGNKVGKMKKTNRDKIIEEIRNNPNVTNKQLSIIIGISETAIENNIRILRENKIIERIGSKKTGFWKIIG